MITTALIEPLRNWNALTDKQYEYIKDSFNRTIEELKQVIY